MCRSGKRGSTWARIKSLVLRCATPYSTYVGRKTTTLWTFQYCIQGTPEAGIRLYNTGQFASECHPKPTYRRSKEHERHDEHSGIQDVDVVVTLCEKLLFRVPCLLHYLLV
jgi:hypothetical protein